MKVHFVVMSFFVFMLFGPSAQALDNNVNITGNLVMEPCSLDPTTSDIELDFGNVVNKYFQTTSRTPGMPFVINLIDCDTSLGQSATVTFIGTPSTALPDLLAPDDGGTGLAFGIETLPNSGNDMNSIQIPINKPSTLFELSEGSTTIQLQGYVQAEPDAISGNTIQSGPFMASATFQVDYP